MAEEPVTVTAWVRCRCFEEERTQPPPLPRDVLSFGPDGMLRLAPGTVLDEGRLEALMAWRETGCDHPAMRFREARLPAARRYFMFFQVGKQLGWGGFPALREVLPQGKASWKDPGLARAALDDLERFRAGLARGLLRAHLEVEETGETVMEVAGKGRTILLSGVSSGVALELDVDGFVARRLKDDAELFRSPEFLQDPQVDPDTGEFQGAELLCLESEKSLVIPIGIGHGAIQRRGPRKVSGFAECLRVVRRQVAVDEFDDVLKALETVLAASWELGQPLVWE